MKITIYYHNRGYSENLQQYIADAKIEAVKEDWKYPDRYIPEATKDRKIHFDHMVTIQFVKLGTLEADEKGYITRNPLALDFRKILYPAFIRTMNAIKITQTTLAIFTAL